MGQLVCIVPGNSLELSLGDYVQVVKAFGWLSVEDFILGTLYTLSELGVHGWSSGNFKSYWSNLLERDSYWGGVIDLEESEHITHTSYLYATYLTQNYKLAKPLSVVDLSIELITGDIHIHGYV